MMQYKNDPFLLLKVQTTEFTNKIDAAVILLNNEVENLNNEVKNLNNEIKIIHNQLLEGKISNEVAMMLLKPSEDTRQRLKSLEDTRQQLKDMRQQLDKIISNISKLINSSFTNKYITNYF